MGSGVFDFAIKHINPDRTSKIKVNNSQIEIDAAYEGTKSFVLVEAKKNLSNDFIIRQLYYPFRTWSSRISKPIKIIFLIYSNSIFLVKHKKYSLEDTYITLDYIYNIFQVLQYQREEEKIPFPQANAFDRIINLCELLYETELTHNEITENYAFNERQTDYYINAGKYLNLLIKKKENNIVSYGLTIKGKKIFSLSYKNKQLELCRQILLHEVFNKSFKYYLFENRIPQKDIIIKIMKSSCIYNITSEQTYVRRASTVYSWINWIVNLQNNTI